MGFAIVIALFAVISSIMIVVDRNEPAPLAPEGNILGDFENDQQGIFGGQLNNKYFKEPIDSIVILFSSETVPGLTLVYYPYEKKLVGGLPKMEVEDVVLFDDRPHWVGYQFKKDGKQYLYYDHEVVASSNFQIFGNTLTAFATGAPANYVYPGFEDFGIE